MAFKSIALILAAAAALTSVPTLTSAQTASRLDARSLSCSALQGALERSGAAIVRYNSPNSNQVVFDRFVTDRRLCTRSFNSKLRSVSIPAADTKRCRVLECGGRPGGGGGNF